MPRRVARIALFLTSSALAACAVTPAATVKDDSAAAPAPRATSTSVGPRPPGDDPRIRKCLEACRQRNMAADCADDEGHMVDCPCHCP